jgi:hypothetical protein
LTHIRLPLITVRDLVSEIKISGFFNDTDIFEGIQFKVYPEILPKKDVQNQTKFKFRGSYLSFSKRKHSALKVEHGGSSMTISRQSGDSQERPIENIPESGTPIHM